MFVCCVHIERKFLLERLLNSSERGEEAFVESERETYQYGQR